MRKIAERLCTELALPEDALLREARISMTGGKRMLIENHRGLMSYSDTSVEVLTGEGKLSVLGSGFIIQAMREKDLLICGKIRNVEWCG